MESTRTLVIVLVALVVGFAGGYFYLWSGESSFGSRVSGRGMQQNIDQHFIAQMIPHHEGAIAMARIAIERSTRPEVRSLAEGIIEAQEQEIEDMTRWYEEWFGSAPPQGGIVRGGMSGRHMAGMEGDVDALRAVSDAAFDREFLEQMIPHHEMAVMMAQMLEASTARAEMLTLADQIIISQNREIDLMRSWLTAWY